MTWVVEYTVRDANQNAKRNTATSKFYLGSALTVAQAEAEAQPLIERIDSMSDGKVVDVSLVYKPDISAWAIKANPNPDANRWEKAMFIWQTVGGWYTRMTVPARKKSIVVANSETIDTTTAGAQGTLFKTEFLAATTTDERGDSVVSLSSAKETAG